MNSNEITLKQHSNQLEKIRCTLWSINKLPLLHTHNALLQLIPLQSLDHFIPMTRECIKVSKRDPYLVKYLHLFDLLLNHPLFNHQLHNCLVEFYSKIVSHLNSQKSWAEIEQCKTMRKYWAKRIHYNLYEQMRTETFRITGIDVDNILSVESIQNIRHYYVHVLHLPPHQLAYYLPQISQLHSAYSSTRPTGRKGTQLNCQQNQRYHDISKSRNKGLPIQPQKDDNKQKNVFNTLTITNTNNHQYYKDITQNFDSPKKLRCQSEQTNADDNVESLRKIRYLNNNQTLFVIPPTKHQQTRPSIQLQEKQKELQLQKPNKIIVEQTPSIIEKSKEHLQALSMLAKLNSLNRYQCRRCGMRFQIEQSLKEHIQFHVTSRLKELSLQEASKLRPIKNIKKLSFVSSVIWTSIAQQLEGIQFNISESELDNLKQLVCPLCSQTIKLGWREQQWVYLNAIRVVIHNDKQKIKQQIFLMHKSCAKMTEKNELLQGSQKISVQ